MAERKQIIKRTTGHFLNLVEHSLRDREPSPEHVLNRMVKPLCEDFADLLRAGGTGADMKKVLIGFVDQCGKVA